MNPRRRTASRPHVGRTSTDVCLPSVSPDHSRQTVAKCESPNPAMYRSSLTLGCAVSAAAWTRTLWLRVTQITSQSKARHMSEIDLHYPLRKPRVSQGFEVRMSAFTVSFSSYLPADRSTGHGGMVTGAWRARSVSVAAALGMIAEDFAGTWRDLVEFNFEFSVLTAATVNNRLDDSIGRSLDSVNAARSPGDDYT